MYFLHYSFQTVVQWSKFEIPHQLIHILNIDKTKIFTSIDHRVQKTNCRFPHPSGWKSNPYEFRNQALVLSFMELHDIPAVVSNFSQLRTLKFIRVLLLVELKVFQTSTSLSRLSLSCSLVSNSRWRLAVFSTSDLRFCVMTVSSFKYWLDW